MMNPLISLYTKVVYRPLLNALVGVYLLLPYRDLGLAIIVLTAAVRLAMHPALRQTLRSQRAMAELQPKLKEIHARFKDDREEQAKRTMALYREHGVHPLSGCLPLILQIPFLFGLYQVFWKGIALADRSLLYSFVPPINGFEPLAFGAVNLTQPSIILAVVAGASQFLQARFMPPMSSAAPEGDMQRIIQLQMRYFFPLLIAGISWSLPSALPLYWTVFNLFAILQQRWIERHIIHERAPRTHQPNPREDGHRGRS